MLSARSTTIAALVLLLAACSTPPVEPVVEGWRGTDVHLVDGTWIGSETSCDDRGANGLECRSVIDQAMKALPPDVRSRVVTAVLADLPTLYVTADGETRTAHLNAGITTRKAVVITMVDGARRVIGLWCHLPYSGNGGGLIVPDVDCGIAPLDYWLDGNAPPSFPPGTTTG